jgi:peptide/nickel transport system permease protein
MDVSTSPYSSAESNALERPSRSGVGRWFVIRRLIRGNLLGLLGALIVLSVVAMALAAPVLAPYDPLAMDLKSALLPPGAEHPFGTDSFGRDQLSRIIYGARVTLLVGTVCVSCALVAGMAIGLTAGYARGTLDTFLMRFMDALLSFPPIILAIALLGALGPSVVNAMLALGIVYTPQIARLVRSTTLSIREELYVTASRSIGTPTWRIIVRHVLPNAIPPVIVQATAMFAYAIIAAATLSFLGLGTQPPTPDWGEMVSKGRAYMQEAYWVVLFPGVAIILFVMGVNFLGDSMRDMMDPRYRKSLF